MRTIHKMKFSLTCMAAIFFFGQNALAQLQLDNLPVACLPDRVKPSTPTEACHCPEPSADYCTGYNMPLFMKAICCGNIYTGSSGSSSSSSSGGISSSSSSGGSGSTSSSSSSGGSGICTNNGCSTGWKFTWVLQPGNNNAMPMWYCDDTPNCDRSVLFSHIPSPVRDQIWELDPARGYPERVATYKTGMIKAPIVGGGILDAWVCDTNIWNPNWQPGDPDAITAQFWILEALEQAMGGPEYVCVIPAYLNYDCFNRISYAYDDIGECLPNEDCMPRDTRVITADNKEVMIQDVKVGDKLRSQTKINTVLQIMVTQSDKRTLYSINKGAFTITEGHPVLTQRGWKTVNRTTAQENRDKKNWAQGTGLRVGDVIVGRSQTIKITSLEPVGAANGETYNLRLDGDNSFLANGILVQGFDAVEVKYDQPEETRDNARK